MNFRGSNFETTQHVLPLPFSTKVATQPWCREPSRGETSLHLSSSFPARTSPRTQMAIRSAMVCSNWASHAELAHREAMRHRKEPRMAPLSWLLSPPIPVQLSSSVFPGTMRMRPLVVNAWTQKLTKRNGGGIITSSGFIWIHLDSSGFICMSPCRN